MADTLEPSATVNAVADRYDIRPNQLSAWRRLPKQRKLVLPAVKVEEPVFAPLVVRDEAQNTAGPKVPMDVAPILIIRGTVVIELAHDAPAISWPS
ncbi:transposase [Halodurantibacterium flavum]|uniref:Transposase n=1 Tax=Halodurantibacterium flavum TaxID=1382802 RepID=A0ABW4RZ80_9RHOB